MAFCLKRACCHVAIAVTYITDGLEVYVHYLPLQEENPDVSLSSSYYNLQVSSVVCTFNCNRLYVRCNKFHQVRAERSDIPSWERSVRHPGMEDTFDLQSHPIFCYIIFPDTHQAHGSGTGSLVHLFHCLLFSAEPTGALTSSKPKLCDRWASCVSERR